MVVYTKKPRLSLYSKLLYDMGHDFLDTQYSAKTTDCKELAALAYT